MIYYIALKGNEALHKTKGIVMATRSPRYYLNFGCVTSKFDGELPQKLMTKEDVEYVLKILNPLKCEKWITDMNSLKRHEKMFIEIIEEKIVKVIKIQRY